MNWSITKTIRKTIIEIITEFIHDEIYIYYETSQEIFTDDGKNLWGDIMQKYLDKIKILHKDMSLYHPRMNEKIERLNDIVGSMLGKLLLNKSTKLWDLYLDQVVFTCRIKTHMMTKTSSFYLLYDRHPHLLGDTNVTLSNDAKAASHDERFKLLQSMWKEVILAIYERAFKNKNAWDKLVQSHKFQEEQWVLIRHDNAQKFESKWFESYQVIQKMLLSMYRLHDFNERELTALIHENRLIETIVSIMNELKELWASLKDKNILRKWNKWMKVRPFYPENIDTLDQYLLNDDDENETIAVPEIVKKSLKRKRGEQEIYEEIIVERWNWW